MGNNRCCPQGWTQRRRANHLLEKGVSMIEKVVGGYLVAALIVSLLVLTLNKKLSKG
jgi:hypothetical protein